MKKAFNLKKALVLVLVLVMCISVFVACDKYDATGLEAARSYVKQLYREVANETSADYSVVSVSLDTTGNSYDVEWSVVVTEGDPNGVKIVVGDNSVTVDVDEYASSEIKYTLTATIKDGDHSLTIDYNRTVPQFVVNTWEEYKAGCEAGDADRSYTIKGYVVGVNATPLSSSVGSLWIVDETGHGYYAYKPTLDAAITESRETINAYFPIGTEVIVRGTLTLYSGAYEFNKNCTVEKTGNTATSKGYNLDYVDLTDKFEEATTNKDESLIPYQATMAELKNVTLADTNGKNYYFTVGSSSVKFVLYNDMYIIDDSIVSEIERLWTVGAKANIKGVVNTYSGVYQIYPTCIESVSIQQQTDAEKVAGVKAGLALESKYRADFELPTSTLVNLAWSVASGTGITIDGSTAKVTRTATDQEVVLKATITSGDVVDTREFNVIVEAEDDPNTFVLTVGTLNLESSKYQDGNATVNGTSFSYVELGNYGDGVQVRIKDSKKSAIYNTVAFGKAIQKIVIKYSDTKTVYADNKYQISFGAASNSLTDVVEYTTVADQKEFTFIPTIDNATFFRYDHVITYSAYFESITIYLDENASVTPVDPTPGTDTDAPDTSTPAATIDLIGQTNRGETTTQKAVFSANGITVTNEKANSTTNISDANGENSTRFYKGSSLKIEYTGMVKIVITADDFSSGNYIKGLDGVTVEGATITRNGDVITITFASAVNSFECVELASQLRVEKIDVYTA